MHTVNRALIDAPADRIYDLAARVEDWPHLLRHYRYVNVLEAVVGADRRSRLIKMGAERSGIPVSWTALQHLDPRNSRIRYRHVGGVTLGMDVVWRLESAAGKTEVTIEHDLLSTRWWLRLAVCEFIVGTVFVESIADHTLAGIKRAAEASR